MALGFIVTFAPALHAEQGPVTEESVNDAVARAVAWVKEQRNEAGHWERGDNTTERYWAGDTALAVLALLYAGEDARGEEMASVIEWLSAQPLNATYTYALRAQVLARVRARDVRNQLRQDLQWLVDAAYPAGQDHPGAYDYQSYAEGHARSRYDNSNSQFGVLGAWMASEAGAHVPDMRAYWELVEKHWLADQSPDGGWPYRGSENSTGSMTAAGLSTLFIVLDRLHGAGGHRRAEDLIKAIEKGLDWFGRSFTPDNPHGSGRWKYYYLYGVERAGRASGRKYFRNRDWFRIGAADLLRQQRGDGSWPGGLHNTCFALLFLCHGRAPVMLNKLEHGEDWDGYLRDAAGLARYAEHTFERLLNWQILSLDADLADLLEAPVLYLGGATEWTFDAAQRARLEAYCRRGGMLFAVAREGEPAFQRSMADLARTLFPEYPPQPLPRTHPLYNGEVQFPLEKPPQVMEVHNGVRSLMLVCLEDVAEAWNEYDVDDQTRDFQLGCNVYLYATDKTAPRSRLETTRIGVEAPAGGRTIRVARIRYDGRWNPEPYGWERFSTWLGNEADVALEVEDAVRLDDPGLADFGIAHVTGTGAFRLDEQERSGLRRFLLNGGTLLADAAGGDREFTAALEREVREVLKVEPLPLRGDSPILTGKGITGAADLATVGYRRSVRGAGAPGQRPPLRGFAFGKRQAVIYSPLDITAGLLGTPVYGCSGYDAPGALRVLRNLILYADLPTADKIAGGE